MEIYFYLAGVLAITLIPLIRAEFKNDQKSIFIFKPLASSILLITASLGFFQPGSDFRYTLLILIGVIFCFGGDVALMFKSKKSFKLGLVLFLSGHIVYAVVFSLYGGISSMDIFSGSILILLAVSVFLFLRKGLGEMKIPVIFYILVITVMVNRAFATIPSGLIIYKQALVISIGATLFYISDLILAVARFKKPYKYNRISLAFYYSGQFLIAMSTGFFIR